MLDNLKNRWLNTFCGKWSFLGWGNLGMPKLPKLPHGVIWVIDTVYILICIFLCPKHTINIIQACGDYWDLLGAQLH